MKNILILASLLLFVSCGGNSSEKILTSSNGGAKQVMLVIDNDVWKGEVGDELRKIISEPIVGLPQPEHQFSISRIPTDHFSGLIKSNRSILYVSANKEHESSFKITKDIYAKPQKIITILAKNNALLASMIRKNADKILEEFQKADVAFVQNKHKKVARKESYIALEKLGVKMTIPRTYNTVYDTIADGNPFLWVRHHLKKGYSLELLAYQVPITTEEDVLGNTIIENRNAIGKKYILGDSEGRYMITEEAYTPHRFDIVIDHKKAYETRGKWEVIDQFMAGPFLNYTIVDKENNRLVVVEGFVFAPMVNKRNHLFELEAIMKSLKFI